MSPRTQQMVKMYEMLPEEEQELAFETIKRFVLVWDPDFTKVTSEERKQIEKAEKSGYISDEDIDWITLNSMQNKKCEQADMIDQLVLF